MNREIAKALIANLYDKDAVEEQMVYLVFHDGEVCAGPRSA